MRLRRPFHDVSLLVSLLAALLGAAGGAAVPAERGAASYAHSFWRVRDGLPQDAVYDLQPTPDGYLWIGTAAGLVRFDGVHFHVFDRSNTAALDNHFVRALAVDGDVLWIGTNGGGLVRHEAGTFRRYGLAEGLPHGRVLSLARSRDGLWIGTYGGGAARLREAGGAARLREAGGAASIEVFGTAEGLRDLSVYALYEDPEGVVWVGTQNGGLHRLEEGPSGARFTSFTTADGLPSDFVYALGTGPRGRLWVGTISGLAVRDGDAFRTVDLPGFGTGRQVSALRWTAGGGLWLGGRGEVFHVPDAASPDAVAVAVLVEGREFPAGDVRGLRLDADGSGVWVGSTGGGLARLRPATFTNFLPDVRTFTFYEDAGGGRWITSARGLYHQPSGGAWRSRTTADGLVSDITWGVFGDAGGGLWVATSGGLQHYSDGIVDSAHLVRTYTVADGLPHDAVFTALPVRGGVVWAGTNGGLARIEPSEGPVRAFRIADGLVNEQVRSLHEDGRGRLWIGTAGGLSRLDGEVFTNWTFADGLESENVWAIREDGAGTLWLATYGGGLHRLSPEGRLSVFSSRQGLPDDNLCTVVNREGDLWMGSTRGVIRLPRSELARFEAGESAALVTTLFNEADGLRHSMCSGVGFPTAEDGEGRLWFPNTAGIAVVDPDDIPPPQQPRRVVIEEVVFDGRPQPAGPVAVPAGNHNLEAHYTALGAREPRRLRFRYRLHGFEDDWQDVGARRVAYYTNLPPGTYRFEVEASREDGTWSGITVALPVEAVPAFYQTVAFAVLLYLLCTAAAVAMGWSVHRYRSLGRFNTELQAMQEEVETKNAALAAKNQELERFAYTVSHDLKSPLVTIQGFLGLLREDLSRDQAGNVTEDIEQIHDAAVKMHELLDGLLDLSRSGEVAQPADGVDLAAAVDDVTGLLGGLLQERGATVEVAGDLPAVRADPRRLRQVFQNLVENAVKYCPSERSPRIVVGARTAGREVVCTVSDNGAGIVPEDCEKVFVLFEKLGSKEAGSGIGLATVERIVQAHGGRVWVESEGTGRGTCFCFTLPRSG